MKYINIALLLLITSCAFLGEGDTSSYPLDPEDERRERRGKLGGEDGGFTLFSSGDEDENQGGGSGIGVNSFLWRATLDTINFMPIQTADPFGGVITTDYYEDPATPGERYKINALILDDRLRVDGIKITLFKQKLDENNSWRDVAVEKKANRQIEDKILTRARELRIEQTGR